MGVIDSGLVDPAEILPLGRPDCVYISHDGLDTGDYVRSEADWIRLPVGVVPLGNRAIGGFFEYNEEEYGTTQTPMWFVPRLP